jgi:hypothetical protein
MPDIPPAPPSPPLRMPNSDLSTDAYAEDETLDDIVIHPEDSASRQQLPFDPELLSPSIGGSALTNVISAVSFPLLMWLPDSRENGRAGCGKTKTEKSTLAKMGNFDGNVKDVRPSSTMCSSLTLA